MFCRRVGTSESRSSETEIARSNARRKRPPRVERGSCRGFERARTRPAELIRYRAVVAGKSWSGARTLRANLARRVASAFRFAAHFLVAEPSVGKNRATRGREGWSDEWSGDGTYGLRTAAKGPGAYLAESRRAGIHRGRAAVARDDEPERIARGAANDEGHAFRGKPARASVKNSPSRPVPGKAETRASGDYRAGKTPRSASEACSRA